MATDELFEDVKAMDRLSQHLTVRNATGVGSAALVSAVERGRRARPDGTVEDYERIEFRDK